jgi:hypothetical protein
MLRANLRSRPGVPVAAALALGREVALALERSQARRVAALRSDVAALALTLEAAERQARRPPEEEHAEAEAASAISLALAVEECSLGAPGAAGAAGRRELAAAEGGGEVAQLRAEGDALFSVAQVAEDEVLARARRGLRDARAEALVLARLVVQRRRDARREARELGAAFVAQSRELAAAQQGGAPPEQLIYEFEAQRLRAALLAADRSLTEVRQRVSAAIALQRLRHALRAAWRLADANVAMSTSTAEAAAAAAAEARAQASRRADFLCAVLRATPYGERVADALRQRAALLRARGADADAAAAFGRSSVRESAGEYEAGLRARRVFAATAGVGYSAR